MCLYLSVRVFEGCQHVISIKINLNCMIIIYQEITHQCFFWNKHFHRIHIDSVFNHTMISSSCFSKKYKNLKFPRRKFYLIFVFQRISKPISYIKSFSNRFRFLKLICNYIFNSIFCKKRCFLKVNNISFHTKYIWIQSGIIS